MKNLSAFMLACAIAPSLATTPPPSAPIGTKICRASHIFVGTASDFRVVESRPGCGKGDGKSLTMCEEVEVKISVSRSIRPDGWLPEKEVTFRFGGGFFSIENLRVDLLGKERYFFTVIDAAGSRFFRTSYPWYLGMEATADADKLVEEELRQCRMPNKTIDPTR